ncbi:Translation initiation factor 3 subunit b [Coemansia nantahalensis]|uniref:Translation initiation factor 3 subunit b n=2 Tax=Coemansia TaxID=4863 RepID=A0ACC1L3K1_9FUNG|nr:Translation initiation factor 3 subunit b [Coemansia nantahalensis]KAJ2775181.1 Translation initiation factor 3 subunit b [Coemansia nantahalensis]KAJ2800767.1 Translation initiation factor 3 subunit b [Coemansia helicoidea]
MAVYTYDNLPASEEDIDFGDLERKFVVPEQEETLENVVVLDNLPVVDTGKVDKLIKTLTSKVFKKAGKVKENGFHMPMGEGARGSESKGYAFVEFETAAQAQAVIRAANGHQFGASHVLRANPFMDVEKYAEVDDAYRAPPAEPFEEREHLRSWLMDDYGRDQFATYARGELGVYWGETAQAAEQIKARSNWTESHVQWSPLGSYMGTFHLQGLVLWGGPSWSKLMRFVHPFISFADFSPSERYLVTMSSKPIDVEAVGARLGPDAAHQNPYSTADQGNSVCVWDARTGTLLRSFPLPTNDDGSPAQPAWPQFKWSPSEKYFARMAYGASISIYEAPSMGLVDKKSLKVPGVQDFSWCPQVLTEARTGAARPEMLAYWTPEDGNLPARVSLVAVPSREIVRTKNLYNVFAAALHWHPSGKMLCVRVQRFTKSKKSRFTNLEIFRTGEKEVPVDVVELKDSAMAFDWEPTEASFRFAILHTEDPTPPPTNMAGMAMATVKTSVSLYSFVRKGKLVQKEGFQLLKTLENKTARSLKWSPRGRHIVLATLRTATNGTIEFYDADFDHAAAAKSGVPGDAIALLATAEHYGVTDMEWDPSGRYVTTWVSARYHPSENGYIMWDFRGQELQQAAVDDLWQFVWRPRPESLLTEEHRREVRRDLKAYAKEFDELDERRLHAADAELMSQRRRLVSEWESWRQQVGEFLAEETDEALASGYTLPIAPDSEDLVVEEIVEEIIDEKEEVVGK